MECDVKNCVQEAEFDIPANLCEEHWTLWFNGATDDSDECLKKVLEGSEQELTLNDTESIMKNSIRQKALLEAKEYLGEEKMT